MNKRTSIGASKTSSEFSCFEVNLSVKYSKPRRFEDPSGGSLLADGYYRKFVVVAASEQQARQFMYGEVEDGTIDWEDSNLKRLSAFDLDEYSLIENIAFGNPGIAYRSSHFLYPATE